MSRGVQVLYLHGLGSSINNRTGTALAEHFRHKKTFFERFIYSNPGSEDKPWRVNEWLKDVEALPTVLLDLFLIVDAHSRKR